MRADKILIASTIVVAATCLFSASTVAAEFRSGLEVIIEANETLDEDVYAVAQQLIIDGTINGDLYAAGASISVTGDINGDLIVAGRSIEVSGAIENDVRAAGANLEFQSTIGEDLIVAGDTVEIGPGSIIRNDLVAGADSIIISGEVAGNAELNVREADIAGAIDGNLQASVEDQLILGPNSRIGGAIDYTSLNELMLPPGAEVGGDVTQELPMVDILGIQYAITTITLIVSKIIEQTKWFIGTLLVGLALIWLFPRTVHNVKETLLESPLKSLGLGVLVFPLLPILLLLLMIAVLSIVGSSALPIIAIPGTAYAALLLLAKPVVAMAVGGFIALRTGKKKQATPIGALAMGAALLAVAGLIPYVDTLLGWLTLLAGFGMWLLFFIRRYRGARAAQSA